MQFWTKPTHPVRHIGFLLFDGFSNLCLANAVEPFRAVNALRQARTFTWDLLSLDGEQVKSSSGISIATTGTLKSATPGDALFVISGYGYRSNATIECQRALRRAAAHYPLIIGMDTGSWLLAAAGLLEGHTATIHWEAYDAFEETFDSVDVSGARYVLDGNRASCGGGATAFELVLDLINSWEGEAVRLDVATFFMNEAFQGSQSIGATRGQSSLVSKALAIMHEHVEDPLPIPALAAQLGRSQKDLSRRFQRELGATPRTVYKHIRLTRVRQLIENTEISISEIATRCGYTNASALSRAFLQTFGSNPSRLR